MDDNLQFSLSRWSTHRLIPQLNRLSLTIRGSRIASGAFWSIAGAVTSRFLLLMASVLVARILGQEAYGEYGMIRTTVNMFLAFAGFGLGMTATKYVAECHVIDPARAGRVMAIGGIFALCTGALVASSLVVFAPWVAARTINAPHLVGELRIGAAILFFNAINGAQTGALAGFQAFKAIAKVNLVAGVVSFPLLVGGAFWGGLRGAIWGLLGSVLTNCLISSSLLRKEAKHHKVPFGYKGCLSEWPILWRFSLPAALSGVMVSPVIWACNAMLVQQPGGYREMGVFDAANQWRMAILFIPGVVGQIVLPLLSNLSGPNDQSKYRKTLKYNAFINGAVALSVSLPVVLLAPYIMSSYGVGFENGTWVLYLLSISTILSALNSVVGQAIASKGHMWAGLCFNGLWGLVVLVTSDILIGYGYGAVGLALANLIAYTFHSLWQSYYIFRLLKSEPIDNI